MSGVVVAMSGGVDSSVAAALLQEQGYDVIGVGLRFPEVVASHPGQITCCGMAGMEDARRVAERIGIPFYVLDYREAFEQTVIEPFCRAYARGETPNPCILCNVELKFGRLLATARAMGADHIATGHYARLEQPIQGGSVRLRKGLDPDHDQSYFLYALTREQLAHSLFPVGDLTKPQVRRIAARLGLSVADKPGSQDICFVGPGGYRELLAQRQPQALRPGPIMDAAGQLLGQHEGIGAYTLGQRRGLGIAAGDRLYVTRVDMAHNALVVGPKAETYTQTLRVAALHWLPDDLPCEGQTVEVKLRYRAAPVRSSIYPQGDEALLRFDQPQPLIAPGQAAVFYDVDVILGGGQVALTREY